MKDKNGRTTVWIRLNAKELDEISMLQRREGRPSRANMIEFAVKSYCDWKLRKIRPGIDVK